MTRLPDYQRPNWSIAQWHLARHSFLRASIEKRMFPGCSTTPGPITANHDPARDILPLWELREALWRSSRIQNDETKRAICAATSAAAFFQSWPEVGICVRAPIRNLDNNYQPDLTRLVQHTAGSEQKGILLEGPIGSGKTTALWQLWHDCLLRSPSINATGDSLLPGYLPFWIDPIVPGWVNDRFFEGDQAKLLIAALLADASGMWSPSLCLGDSDKEQLVEFWKYFLDLGSTTTLVLCDLDAIKKEYRDRVARGIEAFQESTKRHRCVVVRRSSGTANPVNHLNCFQCYKFDLEAFKRHTTGNKFNYAERFAGFVNSVSTQLEIPLGENRVNTKDVSSLQSRLAATEAATSARTRLEAPLRMHAVTTWNFLTSAFPTPPPPLEPNVDSDLAVLWNWRQIYCQMEQSTPPALDHIWEALGHDANCEFVLRKHAQRRKEDWKWKQKQFEPAPYIEPHFAWILDEPIDKSGLDQQLRGASSELRQDRESRNKKKLLDELNLSNVENAGESERHVVVGNREVQHLLMKAARDRAPNGGLRLIISEDASAGKTVFTYRLLAGFCDSNIVMANGPFLVHRWEDRSGSKPWPANKEEIQRDLIEAIKLDVDHSLQVTAENVVNYALGQKRVVFILDAADQTSSVKICSLAPLLQNDPELKFCDVVVTSRAYQLNSDTGRKCFGRDHWTHSAILPFDQEQQDRYLKDVLDDGTQSFKNYDELSELLGIPGMLNMIRELVKKNSVDAINMIRTRCDLHWMYLHKVIFRGQDRTNQPQLQELNLNQLIPIWRAMLSVLAFRMVLQRCNSYAIQGEELSRVTNEVNDYCAKLPDLPKDTNWPEHWQELKKISPISERALFDSNSDSSLLAWRHNSWMEFFCGLFMAQYAEGSFLEAFSFETIHRDLEARAMDRTKSNRDRVLDADKPGFLQADTKKNDKKNGQSLMLDVLRQIANDDSWYWAWRNAMDVPGINHNNDRPTVRDQTLASSLSALFERPPGQPTWYGKWHTLMNEQTETWHSSPAPIGFPVRGARPTELMYRAYILFNTNENMTKYWKEIESSYQAQFFRLLNSDDRLPEGIPSLAIDQSPRVIEVADRSASKRWFAERTTTLNRTVAHVAAELIVEDPATKLPANVYSKNPVTKDRWAQIRPSDDKRAFVPCPPPDHKQQLIRSLEAERKSKLDAIHKVPMDAKRLRDEATEIEGRIKSLDGPPLTIWQRLWQTMKSRASFMWLRKTNKQALASFYQGSAEGVGYRGEHPRHLVKLEPFLMQSTAVTVEQYCGLFDPAHYLLFREEIDKYSPKPDCPIVMMTWWDSFCFSLFMGGGLPTDSQWEFACRAGRDGENELFGIPWTPKSGEIRYDSLSSRQANFHGSYPYGKAEEASFIEKTMPVRSYEANSWGLWQMHGNVWEWVYNDPEDYSERLARMLKVLGIDQAPQTVEEWNYVLCSLGEKAWQRWAESEAKRLNKTPAGVVRWLLGGSWFFFADNARCADRGLSGYRPGFRGASGGFRVVVRDSVMGSQSSEL